MEPFCFSLSNISGTIVKFCNKSADGTFPVERRGPPLEPSHAASFSFRPRGVYPTHSRGASFDTVVEVGSLSTGFMGSVTSSARRGPSDTITIYPGAVIVAVDYARSGGCPAPLAGIHGPIPYIPPSLSIGRLWRSSPSREPGRPGLALRSIQFMRTLFNKGGGSRWPYIPGRQCLRCC